MKNFVIKANEIPAQGLEFHFQNGNKELDQILGDLLDANPKYDIKCSVKAVPNVVHFNGQVSGVLPLNCSRCAESFTQNFTKKFSTAYCDSEENMSSLSEIDDLQTSFDVDFLKGNDINISEIFHEQIALEIPFQPLCQENCKGLCFQCGTNLNFEVCNCKIIKEVTSPFSVLKELKGEL